MAVFKEITEIKDAINSFWNKSVNLQLRSRMQTGFNLYKLLTYKGRKNSVSFTPNTPRTQADKAISILTQARLILRIPLDYLPEEMREKASNIERFLYGCFNMNDVELRKQGMPLLRDQLTWYLCIRGGVFLRPYIYKKDNDHSVATVAAWDRHNVAYGLGKDGLAWAAHPRKADKWQIKSEYDIDIGDKTDETIIDYWDTQNNGVIVGDVWAKKLQKHGFDFTPVYMILAGAMPSIWQENDIYTNVNIGESIYAANRALFPLKAQTLSDRLDLVRRGVNVPLAFVSPDGKKTLDDNIWQTEKPSMVSLAEGDRIEPIFKESMPTDTDPLLGELAIEEQLGGFPRTAYGQLNFRLSGYAINSLNQAILSASQPFLEALKYAYDTTCRSLIDQYADNTKLPPINVRGRTSKNEPFGYPKSDKIKPKDLEGEWYPEVSLEPILPKDDAQRVYMARMLKESGLSSDQTIMDEQLGIQDTDLEQRKLDEQFAANNPLIRLHRMYRSLLERERFDEALLILAEIRRILQAQQMQQAAAMRPRGAQAPGGLEMEAAGTPGVGMPTGETGFPPEVMPPESLGGMPAGAMGAEGMA